MEKVPGVIAAAGGTFVPPLGYSVPINLATTTGENIRFDGLIMGEGMTELLGIKRSGTNKNLNFKKNNLR